MAGLLIVFEGTDGSGKSTQFHVPCAAGPPSPAAVSRSWSSPYSEPSSALIRMYLGGSSAPTPRT